MSASCHPLPASLAEEMLQVAARALCDRPGDNAAERESRTRQMVHATLGLEPRDGLELMLATMTFGHFQLILDSMSEVFHDGEGPAKAKAKSTIVALGRAMLGMMKELRLQQRRRPAQAADAAVPVAEPEAQTAPAAGAEPPPVAPEESSPVAPAVVVDPRLGLPEEVVAWLTGALPPEFPPAPSDQLAASGLAAALADAASLAFGGTGQPSVSGLDFPTWETDGEAVEDVAARQRALAAAPRPVTHGQNEARPLVASAA